MQPIPEWLVPGMHTPLESKSWLVEEGGTVPILVTKPWVREACLKFGIEFRTIALGVSDPEREQRPLGGVRRLRENRCARRREERTRGRRLVGWYRPGPAPKQQVSGLFTPHTPAPGLAACCISSVVIELPAPSLTRLFLHSGSIPSALLLCHVLSQVLSSHR